MSAADLLAAHLDDCVVRVELATDELVRLEDGHHAVDARARLERQAGQLLAVTDGADYRHAFAGRDVSAGAHPFDPLDDVGDLLGGRALVHDDHHTQWSSFVSAP